MLLFDLAVEGDTMSRSEKIPLPLAVRTAFAWQKYSPRGKGYIPRLIGKWCSTDHNPYFVKTRGGFDLQIDLARLDVYGAIYNNNGTWNQDIMDAVQRLLMPGDVFYDIGANAGLFTIDSFGAFGGKIKVYAFEHQESLAACIMASAEANGFGDGIEVKPFLLWRKDGVAELYLGSHSIHASIKTRKVNSNIVSLPVRSIDSLVYNDCISKPNLIKIDVEGAELGVFQGAKRILGESKPVIIFKADEKMQNFGYNHKDFINYLLSSADYEIFKIVNGGNLASIYRTNSFGNYAAIPSGRLGTNLLAWKPLKIGLRALPGSLDS
jgi:FkbM family methyltransferase